MGKDVRISGKIRRPEQKIMCLNIERFIKCLKDITEDSRGDVYEDILRAYKKATVEEKKRSNEKPYW